MRIFSDGRKSTDFASLGELYQFTAAKPTSLKKFLTGLTPIRHSDLKSDHVSLAVTAEKTPQQAMDLLAEQMDDVLSRLEQSGMKECAPRLNTPKDPQVWLDAPGAPRPKLADEKPKGETVPYEQLLQAWMEGRVK